MSKTVNSGINQDRITLSKDPVNRSVKRKLDYTVLHFKKTSEIGLIITCEHNL